MEVRAGVWFSRRDSAMDGGQPHACLARRSPRSLGSVVRTSSQMRRSDPRWRGAPPPRRTAPSDPGWAFHGPAVMRAATCRRQVGRASPLKGHISLWLAASRHRCKWRGRHRAMSRSDEPFCPPPWWRGGWRRAQGRIGPDGRSSRDGTGCPFTAAPSTSPAAGTPARRRRAGAPPRGVFSLVPFSGQAEKGTRAILSVRFGSSVLSRRGIPEQDMANEEGEPQA